MLAETAFELIRRAFDCDRMAQAYVVAGNLRGNAGELTQRVFQLLFCRAEGARPCGTCDACRHVAEHTHADVLWIESQMKSRRISIDNIRSLQHRVLQTSFGGGWKACAIVGADRLGDEAANAFLKTLEEPPPRTLFMLLTDSPQFLLPTIVSRCQRLDLEGSEALLPEPWHSRLGEVLAGHLRRKGTIAAMATAGAIGALFEDLKAEAESVVKEDETEAVVDDSSDVLKARISARYREMRTGVLRGILAWYRDILLLTTGEDPGVLHYPEQLDALRGGAARLTLRQALSNVEAVQEMNRQLERSMSEQAVLAYWMARLV